MKLKNKRGGPGMRSKQKIDPILSSGIKVEEIDYKNVGLLSGFITTRGTIAPRRASRLKASTQILVAKAIKRARMMALLPFDRVSKN